MLCMGTPRMEAFCPLRRNTGYPESPSRQEQGQMAHPKADWTGTHKGWWAVHRHTQRLWSMLGPQRWKHPLSAALQAWRFGSGVRMEPGAGRARTEGRVPHGSHGLRPTSPRQTDRDRNTSTSQKYLSSILLQKKRVYLISDQQSLSKIAEGS